MDSEAKIDKDIDNVNLPIKIVKWIIIILIILSVIVCIFNNESLYAVISFLIAFISIELGFLSYEIGLESKKIAIESKEQMQAFAKTEFFAISDNLDNEVILIRKFQEYTPKSVSFNNFIRTRKTLVWNCRKFISQAKVLKKWISQSNRDKIGKRLEGIMEILFEENARRAIINEEIKNVVKSYIYVWEFDISQYILDDLENKFLEHIAEIRVAEKFDKEYLQQIYREIKIKYPKNKDIDKYNKLTIEMRNKIKLISD